MFNFKAQQRLHDMVGGEPDTYVFRLVAQYFEYPMPDVMRAALEAQYADEIAQSEGRFKLPQAEVAGQRYNTGEILADSSNYARRELLYTSHPYDEQDAYFSGMGHEPERDCPMRLDLFRVEQAYYDAMRSMAPDFRRNRHNHETDADGHSFALIPIFSVYDFNALPVSEMGIMKPLTIIPGLHVQPEQGYDANTVPTGPA